MRSRSNSDGVIVNFYTQPLGRRSAGDVVEVTLTGNAANVQLLDTANLASFKANRSYKGIGGHAKQSPVRLRIPSAGDWHVTVDYGGHSGSGRVGVRVLSER